MSAWIVSKGHIDAIVQLAIVEQQIGPSEANAVGAMLWAENHASVNYRYNEDTPVPDYAFRGVEAPLDDWIMLKQLECYDYQSCEHPQWAASAGRALVGKLEDRLLRRLGINPRGSESYVAAPWGINEIEEAIAKAVAR